MNYFQLINAVLEQLDLPKLQTFDEAQLPMHTKIMEYINRANKDIITYHDWNFKKQYQKEENLSENSEAESENCAKCKNTIEENKKQFFVKNIFGEFSRNFHNEYDKSIIPEPYGSEMIIYWVAAEIKQEPNNPKYIHWKQRYYKAYSELNAADGNCLKNPIFKIKRG